RLTSRPRRAEVAALMAGLTAERRSLWATLAASTPGPRDATALARWLWAVDGAALEDAAARGLLTDDAHGLRFATELDGCAVYGACSPSERLLAHRRLADLYRCERARLWQRAQTAPSGSPLLAARLEREALTALAGGAVDDAERLVAHALLVDPGTAGERRHRRTLLHARCLDAVGRPRAALAVLDAGPPRTTLPGAPPTGDFATRELRARCAVRATNAQVGGLQLAELLAVSCGPRRTRVVREARLADALAGGSAATAAAAGDPVGPAEIAAAAACLAVDDPGEAAALLDRLPSATGLRRDEPLRLLAEAIGARIAHDQRSALERLAAAERAAVEQPVVAAHVALVRSEVRSIAGPLTTVVADDQLEARLRDHGLHGLQWRRLWVQGRLALLAGDAAAALQALGSAVEAREASGTGVPPALALDRAEAAARAKSGPGSALAIPGLLATPGGVAPVRWQAAQVALLRAVEADAVEAAVAPLMDATATTWVWRDGFVLLSAGLRLRRARRRRAAAAVLAGAEAILLATGATPWAERAGEALAVVDGRRGATTTPLTAAELRAAELAASGLRNREIADRLAVAEKTVEQRLTIVYRKLDVRSRVELRARLDPQGDITTARS
ncbi:helix-turn-helix transcriptional regulator, partial [Patulibacter medicamentivorans]